MYAPNVGANLTDSAGFTNLATFADSTHGLPVDADLPLHMLPIQESGAFVRIDDRMRVADQPAASTTRPAGTSQAASAAVDASRQVLVRCMENANRPTGTRVEQTTLKKLTNYLEDCVRHQFRIDRHQLLDSLKFLDGTYGFGSNIRLSAVKDMQARFDFGFGGDHEMRTLLDSLQTQVFPGRHDLSSFTKSVRRTLLTALWNEDALAALHGATVDYMQKGGRMDISPDGIPEFFQMLMDNHMDHVTPEGRHAIHVMLTKPAGYVEERVDGQRPIVWHDPDAPADADVPVHPDAPVRTDAVHPAEPEPTEESQPLARTPKHALDAAEFTETAKRQATGVSFAFNPEQPEQPEQPEHPQHAGFPDSPAFPFEVDGDASALVDWSVDPMPWMTAAVSPASVSSVPDAEDLETARDASPALQRMPLPN